MERERWPIGQPGSPFGELGAGINVVHVVLDFNLFGCFGGLVGFAVSRKQRREEEEVDEGWLEESITRGYCDGNERGKGQRKGKGTDRRRTKRINE